MVLRGYDPVIASMASSPLRSLQEDGEVAGITLARVFFSEMTGTAFLMLLGVGVCANVTLSKTPGRSEAAWLLVCFGWALAVFVGVIAAGRSGAHLNPAVTLAMTIKESLAITVEGNPTNAKAHFMPSVRITGGSFFTYIAGELVGAALGAFVAWLAYKKHFDEHATKEDPKPESIRGCFCTTPAIRNYPWNLVTEIIATFTLIFSIFSFDNEGSGWAANLGPLSVMFVILVCGASLGGPTGFAMNPARDLMPRCVHALLPIANKADGDWGYSWVPVVGPLIGGCLAGLLGYVFYDLL